MTTPSTYLLVNEELYRQGKIDILSAKSGILLSRENAKRINILMASERIYKTKISNSLNKIKLNMRKFLDQLPKAREAIISAPKKEITAKRKIPNANDDAIRDELAMITSKLEELNGLQ
jgi:hypothetical protein